MGNLKKIEEGLAKNSKDKALKKKQKELLIRKNELENEAIELNKKLNPEKIKKNK